MPNAQSLLRSRTQLLVATYITVPEVPEAVSTPFHFMNLAIHPPECQLFQSYLTSRWHKISIGPYSFEFRMPFNDKEVQRREEWFCIHELIPVTRPMLDRRLGGVRCEWLQLNLLGKVGLRARFQVYGIAYRPICGYQRGRDEASWKRGQNQARSRIYETSASCELYLYILRHLLTNVCSASFS